MDVINKHKKAIAIEAVAFLQLNEKLYYPFKRRDSKGHAVSATWITIKHDKSTN